MLFSKIFCVLVKALYGSTHPEYIDYIYLVLPISLVLINPIGFLMMEIEAQRRQLSRPEIGRCALLRRVLVGIAMNPMIISTVIGVIGKYRLVIFQRIGYRSRSINNRSSISFFR